MTKNSLSGTEIIQGIADEALPCMCDAPICPSYAKAGLIERLAPLARLVDAARKLANESRAITGIAELELRQAVGNSNTSVFLQRTVEVVEALRECEAAARRE